MRNETLNCTNHSKSTRDVTPENPWFQGLDMTPNICLLVQNVTIICHFVEDLFLFIWKDDVGMESLYHQQSFTQGPWSFPQYLHKYKVLWAVNLDTIPALVIKITPWLHDDSLPHYEKFITLQICSGIKIWDEYMYCKCVWKKLQYKCNIPDFFSMTAVISYKILLLFNQWDPCLGGNILKLNK